MDTDNISLDFIDELVAQEAANKELLKMSQELKAEGKIATHLLAAQKLFENDLIEGTFASLRRAQSRAEGLIEKLMNYRAKVN